VKNLPSEEKLNSNKEVVKGIVADLRSAKGAVLVDYRGINVSQDTELRAALRKAGVKYRVVKNTMATFAVRELGLLELEKTLSGPTALATSDTDAIAAAKVMSEFAKKIDKLEIKAGVVDGKVVGVAGVQTLAELPPRDILIATVLGTMKAPLSGFVNVLSANLSGLARTLSAIADQRRQQEAS
jgi:large subunit ribosomal protein L10